MARRHVHKGGCNSQHRKHPYKDPTPQWDARPYGDTADFNHGNVSLSKPTPLNQTRYSRSSFHRLGTRDAEAMDCRRAFAHAETGETKHTRSGHYAEAWLTRFMQKLRVRHITQARAIFANKPEREPSILLIIQLNFFTVVFSGLFSAEAVQRFSKDSECPCLEMSPRQQGIKSARSISAQVILLRGWSSHLRRSR
jgi:hypothetical protein